MFLRQKTVFQKTNTCFGQIYWLFFETNALILRSLAVTDMHKTIVIRR